jgi:hypothetical protein
MRIWSIHPKHLDAKGLVALWRETLLAKNVLEGKTKGYRNHPQLTRFKEVADPVGAICQYLSSVYDEATARGYNFNKEKINVTFKPVEMSVTTGQIAYETAHLLRKLAVRDPNRYEDLKNMPVLTLHPLFKPVDGAVENWEVI